jgi:DNA modification methylase
MEVKYKPNNIYNVDSYKAIKEIPDKSIDLIVTDPPYQIDNTTAGGNSDLSKTIQNMNTELSENQLDKSIDFDILNDFIRVMKKINVYIFCNHKQIPDYLDFFVKKHNCNFDILIWHKPNAMPLFNNKYLTDKEYCLYFRKNAYCNPENYQDASTVYTDIINIKDKKLFNHPTIKPIELIKKLIRNSSKENDIVADFFLGSGTTAVACKELNRKYIGFEKDEKWHRISLDRLEGITQEDRKVEELGQMTIFDL